MAFQVKEFNSIQKGSGTEWKFKLINKSTSEFSFYDLAEDTRTLLDLANDISGQMDLEIQNRTKKPQPKNRFIRKATQKIIKALQLSLTSFSQDIGQQVDTVKAFFKKQKLPQHKLAGLVQKCKRWTMSTWKEVTALLQQQGLFEQEQLYAFILSLQHIQLSLENEDYFKATQKYIQSYVKDSKKINHDFQHHTELYGVLIGDENHAETLSSEMERESLIQIDVNLTIDNKYISQCLLYNAQNLSYIKTKNFSQHFVSDLLRQNHIENMDKEAVQELEEQVRIQIRSQCLYKTLLKKHASVLLNFSTIEIPSEVKEYLIPIEIKLKNEDGEIEYQDYFEWDILNENNNIERFCQQLIEDSELDPKYFSQLCYCIRSQINTELEWKFMLLVKTFKSIHKDKESPKLNTQTTMMIKKNLPYTMDVLMLPENKSYKPNENIVFANSDVFSLLSRNIDILPEEFQTFLLDKQSKEKNEEVMEKTEVTSAKSTSNIRNLSQVYDRKGIKLEANPYLSCVNQIQSNNVWKRLIDEKTNVE